MSQVAQGQLRSFVERIERLNEEIDALNADKREVYAEAKGNGFDVKALKAVIAKRRRDPGETQEHEAVVDLYWHALEGTPFPVDNSDNLGHARLRAHEAVLPPEGGGVSVNPSFGDGGGKPTRMSGASPNQFGGRA